MNPSHARNSVPPPAPRPRASRRLWLLVILAALAAFALRLATSSGRPMHTDEAVNAVMFGRMLEGEPLRYDPQDRHGPTLLWAALPIVRLLGVDSLARLQAWQVRVGPALASAALLLALPVLAAALGRGAVAGAMPWLVAGAPMVYFGGAFIHESLFALLTLLLIAAAWSWFQHPTAGRAAAAGVCAGLLVATKETAAITFLAFVLAAGGCWVSGARIAAAEHPRRPWWRHGPIALGVAVVVATAVFASFGQNPGGPVDAARGWFRFIGRAAGEGHEKPWFTYAAWLLGPNVRTLPWFGWTLLAFGLAGAAAAFRLRREAPLGWFLTLFAAATAIVYSAIPYKTPWLMLTFAAPAALVAGLGVAALMARVRKLAQPWAGAVVAGLLLAALGWETRQLCFEFPVDPTNPLAYVATVPDVETVPALIARRLEDRALQDAPLIQVIGGDFWPLPWYLRTFPRVGYWPELPASDPGDVVIATGASLRAVAAWLGAGWRADIVGLRPEVHAVIYTRDDAGEPRAQSSAAPRPRVPPSDPALSPMSPVPHVFAHQAMATTFEVRAVHPDAGYVAKAAQACFDEIDRLEGLLSRFDPASEVAAIARLEPGESLALNADTFACLRIALEIHALTGGAFDPTLGAALDRRRGEGPALDRGGPRGRLLLDPAARAVQVVDGVVALDLGAIGKGYALDCAAVILRDWEIERALVVAGGSSMLALAGPGPGAGWRIGLGADVSTHSLSLEHGAVGASGTTVQGGHILDPRSGEPAAGAWRAWALAPTAAVADALSTAWMILEAGEIAEVCRQRPEAGAILLPTRDAAPVGFGRVPALAAASRADAFPFA